MKKVIIASQNPVKINAVRIGFGKMFPNEKFKFKGVLVPSNVSDQPASDQEIMTGAGNRANNAYKVLKNADYWVGIEGGVEKLDREMRVFAWVVIKSNDISGKAKTGTFFLPKKIVELVDKGKELGDADDIVFGRTNSKQKNGTVGMLTKNVVDRTGYYVEAVILALIPFRNPQLY